jgi:site-specific DNA-cytosine methylase
MENVPQLASLQGGAFLREIVASLERTGYPEASVLASRT